MVTREQRGRCSSDLPGAAEGGCFQAVDLWEAGGCCLWGRWVSKEEQGLGLLVVYGFSLGCI